MKLFVGLLVLVLSGCASEKYFHPAPNPYEHVKTIAIVEIANETGDKGFDPAKAADALASEILMHKGFRVVRPAQLAAAAEGAGVTLGTDEGRFIAARAVEADLLVVAVVTESKSYYPPRTVVSFQLMSTDASRRARLNQEFEQVFDGENGNTRDEVAAWAEVRVDGDSAWRDGEGVMRARDPWWRFVCARLVERFIATEEGRREAERQKWHMTENP